MLSSATNQEFVLDEEFEKKNDKLIVEMVEFYYLSPANTDNYYDKADALSRRFEKAQKLLQNYTDLHAQKKAELAKLRSFEGLLIGERGKFFKKTTGALVETFEQADKYTKYVDRMFSFLSDMTLVLKDLATLTEYNNKVVKQGRRPSPAEFGSISFLEKYLDEDFTFRDEGKIKDLFPYSGEVLERYRNYFAAYYAYEKAVYAKDYQSIDYKVNKLSRAAAELNIDSERLFGDKGDEMDKIYSDYQNKQVEVVRLIKEFKKKGQGKFLLFEAQEKFSEDLILCGVYANKTFGAMLQKDKKNPTAKNTKEIQEELSNYDPDTSDLDKQINEGSVTIVNSEDQIEFKCTDKNIGKTYSLTRDKIKPKTIEK